jgi:hypothetical protein
MTENYNRPPEEAREEILQLLGKVEVEDFPTTGIYSSVFDRVSQAPGILLDLKGKTELNSGTLKIAMPGGIFESPTYSQVLLGSNGKISRFPMRESMREVSPEIRSER